MFDLVVHLDRVALWFVGIPEFYRFCRCLTFEHAVFSHTVMTGQELDKKHGNTERSTDIPLTILVRKHLFRTLSDVEEEKRTQQSRTRISVAGYIRFALVVGPARRETAMVYDVSDTRGEKRHCTAHT